MPHSMISSDQNGEDVTGMLYVATYVHKLLSKDLEALFLHGYIQFGVIQLHLCMPVSIYH